MAAAAWERREKAGVSRLRRFARAKRGAAAVEIALLAAPFFWLTLGLAEITLIGFAQTTLDFSVSEVAREIRTGQVQTDGLTEIEIKEDICGRMNRMLVMDCNHLYLDVKSFTGFVNVTNPNPVGANNSLNTASFGFAPGNPSDIVLVRAFYEWDVITPYFEQFFANVNGTDRLLTSTILFRNEPFPAPTS